MSAPAGFNATYVCSRHPERPVVAPIACRRCQECHDDSLHRYGEFKIREDQDKRLHGDPNAKGQTPWGETIDETKVRKRIERIV